MRPLTGETGPFGALFRGLHLVILPMAATPLRERGCLPLKGRSAAPATILGCKKTITEAVAGLPVSEEALLAGAFPPVALATALRLRLRREVIGDP